MASRKLVGRPHTTKLSQLIMGIEPAKRNNVGPMAYQAEKPAKKTAKNRSKMGT
jgi:hypothetical protein